MDGTRTYYAISANRLIDSAPLVVTDEQRSWVQDKQRGGGTEPKMRDVSYLRVVQDFDE